MARTQDLFYTYDTMVVDILYDMGYSPSGTLNRGGTVAYLYYSLPEDIAMLADDFGPLDWGSLYYSTENQIGF